MIQLDAACEIQDALTSQHQLSKPIAEGQQRDTVAVLRQKSAEVSETHLGNVHHVEAAYARFDQPHDAIDGVTAGGDDEHHSSLDVTRLPRDVEHVDDGVVHRKVDDVAQLPANGGAQLVGVNLRSFDLDQFVILCAQNAADTGAREFAAAIQGRQNVLGLDLDRRMDGAMAQQRSLALAGAHDRQCGLAIRRHHADPPRAVLLRFPPGKH